MRKHFRTNNTKRVVKYALSKYNAFTNTPLETLSQEEAINFYEHLRQTLQPTSAHTIIRALALLTDNKVFCTIRHVEPQSLRPRKPAPLISFDLVTAIINTGRTPKERLILALLFGTGARAQEVANIKKKDITHKSVTFYDTKTAPVLELPLPKFIVPYLKQYTPPTETTHLFLTPTGLPLSYKWVYDIFKRACAIHNVKASPHAARATAITKLLTDGKSLEEVAACVGHATIFTTKKYDRRCKQTLAKQALLHHSYP